MYRLIYASEGVRDDNYFIETDTLDEILSACLDAYDKNYQLLEIQINGQTLYSGCDIYRIIDKVYY